MQAKHVQLQPEQGAVVCAYQRLSASIQLEASQLAKVYGQEGSANVLMGLLAQLVRATDTYVADCQRAIVIAHEMPTNGTPPIIPSL